MSNKGLLPLLMQCMNDVQNGLYVPSTAAKVASGELGLDEVGNSGVEILVAKT